MQIRLVPGETFQWCLSLSVVDSDVLEYDHSSSEAVLNGPSDLELESSHKRWIRIES